MGERGAGTGGGGQRPGKAPRKVSPRYLENAALHYLKRYSATVAQLRRVMTRKVNRSLRFHGGDAAQALGWLDVLVEKLQRSGLLNDASFAEHRARSLRSSGRSARVIGQKLRQKGVPQAVAAEKLAEATREVSEEEAARIWARRKRLGPFRRQASTREEHQKDLARLARAGFSYAVAKRVLSEPEP